MRCFPALKALMAAGLLLLPLELLHAGDRVPVSMSARFACSETLRGNRAAALEVELGNRGAAFEGRLVFLPFEGSSAFEKKVQVPSKSTRRILIPFFAGGVRPIRSSLSLLDAAGAEKTRLEIQGLVSGKLGMFLEVGRARNFGLKIAIAGDDYRQLNGMAAVDPADFPDAWEALDPFDAILLDSEDFGGFTGAQQDAIREWVIRGGILVAISSSGDPSWAGTFVSSCLSLKIGPWSESPKTSGLGQFARLSGGSIIGNPGRIGWRSCSAAAGKTVIREGTNHLVCRGRLGRGTIFFLAFDPSRQGLNDWEGLPHFWRTLLASWMQSGSQRPGEPHYNAAEEAICSAISPGAGMRTPVYWMLLAVIFYALLIGPVEYYVLKRLGRRELTVYTFPATVLAATILAAAAAWSASGAVVIQNELTVEDIDPVTGDSAFDTWTGVYAPSRVTLAAAPASPGFASDKPAHDLSGFRAASAIGTAFDGRGGFKATIPLNQTKFFRLQGVLARNKPPLAVSVLVERGIVEGVEKTVEYSVEVANGLESALRDCAIFSGMNPVVGGRALFLDGEIGPGEKKSFSLKAGTVKTAFLDPWLSKFETSSGISRSFPWTGKPQEMMPILSFFRPKSRDVFYEHFETYVKRGLALRDQLTAGAVIFTGWTRGHEPAFNLEGAGARVDKSFRWVRLDVTSEVELAGGDEAEEPAEDGGGSGGPR